MWTLTFWRDAAERSVRTFAQATGAVIVMSSGTIGLLDVNWVQALSVGGLAAVASLLFSVGGEVVSPTGTAAFGRSRTPDDLDH